ncbi:MAG TPA: hypothetical protein VGM88_03125 [Kofleriaceae bacterium]|jgi:SAM-dependent methyltransferase
MSMPRAPGRIVADGVPEAADAMAAALMAPHRDHEIAESLTHPFHSYPARVHPATARVLVDVVIAAGGRRHGPIVDPFCGSGTTLVEALAAGYEAFGGDLNPLAVLVARAKTWIAPRGRLKAMRDKAHSIAGYALEAGKAARRAGAEQAPMRKPEGFDPNARNRRLASWFAPHVRRELEHLAMQTDELRARDEEMGEVLTACLSAILYKVSSRTSDTNGKWIDRTIARGAAARNFAQRAELLAAGLEDLARDAKGVQMPRIVEQDARKLALPVPAAGIVTSPPYAGTYDYAEHQRLRFDFLGLRHRELDAGEIGSRRSFEASPEAEGQWKTALTDAMSSIARALAPGACAALVIGDSVARNRAHYALDDLRDALTDELSIEAWASQERPMLGRVELRAFADRPKAEHVVLLRRR